MQTKFIPIVSLAAVGIITLGGVFAYTSAAHCNDLSNQYIAAMTSSVPHVLPYDQAVLHANYVHACDSGNNASADAAVAYWRATDGR